eukprot:4470136-Pleurochrysis_carterae.AAC.1
MRSAPHSRYACRRLLLVAATSKRSQSGSQSVLCLGHARERTIAPSLDQGRWLTMVDGEGRRAACLVGAQATRSSLARSCSSCSSACRGWREPTSTSAPERVNRPERAVRIRSPRRRTGLVAAGGQAHTRASPHGRLQMKLPPACSGLTCARARLVPRERAFLCRLLRRSYLDAGAMQWYRS